MKRLVLRNGEDMVSLCVRNGAGYFDISVCDEFVWRVKVYLNMDDVFSVSWTSLFRQQS